MADRVWKTASFAMLAGAVILFAFGYAGSATNYLDTNPHTPDSATGRTYPYNYHGIVIYLTATEQRRLDFFGYFPFVLFGAGALIAEVKFRVLIRGRGPFRAPH